MPVITGGVICPADVAMIWISSPIVTSVINRQGNSLAMPVTDEMEGCLQEIARRYLSGKMKTGSAPGTGHAVACRNSKLVHRTETRHEQA